MKPKLVVSNDHDYEMMPTRIQVTRFDTLVAEVIVHQKDAPSLWSRYAVAKYRVGKPSGCCIMQRADLPRIWNIPVGSKINSEGKVTNGK